MTVEGWLEAAIADARRRGLSELEPMLQTLARSTAALRAADAETRDDHLAAAVRPDPDPASSG